MKRAEIIEKLRAFPYDSKQYWVITGGAMVLYGIREEATDIDLGCTSAMADRLEAEGFLHKITPDRNRWFKLGGDIEVFENWLNGTVDSAGGIPVVSLQGLLEMKRGLGRPKDRADVELIEEFLASNRAYWEKSWETTDKEALLRHVREHRERYAESEEIVIFKKEGLRRVCDAGCGFGAYTLALAEQGFSVHSFDISERAVECARSILAECGYDAEIKRSDILKSGYLDGEFDGAFAHSVLDHMSCADAKKALDELCRIVRKGGLILLSFDTADEDDLAEPHELLPDGSLLYTGASRKNGMVFHPYDRFEIRALVEGKETVFESVNQKGEQIIIIRN
ncbi:MAG: class I SAM-dependent methyltransferase [Clostridia bacterium]|nr:class I SAM-dependent methyltransferase [Clostridia bacterium]